MIFCNLKKYSLRKSTTTTTILWLSGFCPGLPGWASTSKVKPKPVWISWSKRVSGSGISWAICKSAPHRSQITMPAPHHSVYYRPDALPAAQPTASKHWRYGTEGNQMEEINVRYWIIPIKTGWMFFLIVVKGVVLNKWPLNSCCYQEAPCGDSSVTTSSLQLLHCMQVQGSVKKFWA